MYTDPQGVVDYLFCTAADFDPVDVRLKEGQALLWFTEDAARRTPFAFGYNRLVAEFFGALRDGTV